MTLAARDAAIREAEKREENAKYAKKAVPRRFNLSAVSRAWVGELARDRQLDSKLHRARSRLYRSRSLRVNTK